MSDAAVLVAGGAGFIGSHACKALHGAGFLPIVLDDLSTGHAQAVRWGPFYRGRTDDHALITDVVRRHDVRAVMHFAAWSNVGESMSRPLEYYANNVASAVALSRAVVEQGVKAFVYSSTAAVYGRPDVTLISEDHPLAPINPYGQSKLAFEQALPWIEAAHGLKWTSLRYFNAAGADPDGEIGESHAPETHLIPLVCDAALGLGPALSVYGDDYDTPDGTAIRDYIHVSDLAQAHVSALRRMLGGGDSAILNVGTGQGASVKAVLDCARDVLEREVPFSMGPRRAGDPPVLVADSRQIRDTLDWEPRRSDLTTIVRDAARWRMQRPF